MHRPDDAASAVGSAGSPPVGTPARGEGLAALAAAEWRERLARFEAATGLEVAVRPWPPPPRDFGQHRHPVCRIVNEIGQSCAACREAHQRVRREAWEARGTAFIRCPSGLVFFALGVGAGGEEGVAPFLLEGGRVACLRPTAADLEALWARLSGESREARWAELRAVLERMPLVPADRLRAGVELLAWLAAAEVREIGRRRRADRAAGDPAGVEGGRSPAFVEETWTILRHRFRERLAVTELARAAGLSPDHFSRVFRRWTGRTPVAALQELRVEEACRLLARPDLRVAEVAYAAGFESVPHFNRVFRARTGTAPGDWRRRAAAGGRAGGGAAPDGRGGAGNAQPAT